MAAPGKSRDISLATRATEIEAAKVLMSPHYPDRSGQVRRDSDERPRFIYAGRRRNAADSFVGSDSILATAINAAGTGNIHDVVRRGVASARFIGESRSFFPSLYSSLSLLSLFRRSLRGKPPAEMRRAATREWNIIARRGIALFFVVTRLLASPLSPSVSSPFRPLAHIIFSLSLSRRLLISLTSGSRD